MMFSNIETLLAPEPMALETGCEICGHFYLGQELPALGKSPAEIAQISPDELGITLLQHCYNEFTSLSRFLPSMREAENRQAVKPELSR